MAFWKISMCSVTIYECGKLEQKINQKITHLLWIYKTYLKATPPESTQTEIEMVKCLQKSALTCTF